MKISPCTLTGFDAPVEGQIDEVAVVQIDIDGHCEDKVFFYVAPRLALYDLILELPWFKGQDVHLNPQRSWLTIHSTGTRVCNRTVEEDQKLDCTSISAVGFSALARRSKKDNIQIFSASLADIEKALTLKKRIDPRTKLPKHYHKLLDVFDHPESDKLPPLHRPGIDH
jgi:hypothetical protein